ncbi:hypothetical protein [Isorropodon fossajaponicum symbiont]|uniref:hypothetical protein n=1 Tax=Isorropodon fossajaponicum symbiont TaxID=883811 RepID=UPI001914E350|nr:hypothetical protein [Isorropodon fossajaponicum symbiont]
MTQYKSRKQRVTFTVEHSVQYPLEGGTLDYAKLMVHENYTNKKNHDNIRSLLLSS